MRRARKGSIEEKNFAILGADHAKAIECCAAFSHQ
jgi:hypothetical protein